MNFGPNEIDKFSSSLTGTMYVVMKEDPDGIKEPQILGVCRKRMSIDKIRTKLGLTHNANITIKGPVPFLEDISFGFPKPNPLKPEVDPFKPDFTDPKFDPKGPNFYPKVDPFKPVFKEPKKPPF